MIEFGFGMVADVLLGVGAIGAAIYCMILTRKLSGLTGLDQELGSAIALLSQQVDEMTAALTAAQEAAAISRGEMETLKSRTNELESSLENLSASAPQGHSSAKPNADFGGLSDGKTSLFVRHNRAVNS